MSILPMSAQIVVKSATLVGIVGAVITGQWSFLQEHLIGNRGDDLRTEQSRSAMPRTSTSQQLGVPVAQTAVAA
jgi:Mn2+/Fe2+ NRAMP family transporter